MVGVRSEEEYKTKKLPFVKKQYGVFDPSSGGVIIVKSREIAHNPGDSRFIPMVRHVSEWLEDTEGRDGSAGQ